MLLSCLDSVSEQAFSAEMTHTSAEEHPCIGSQSCSLYRTGKVLLRRTSVCVHDSDCMPG